MIAAGLLLPANIKAILIALITHSKYRFLPKLARSMMATSTIQTSNLTAETPKTTPARTHKKSLNPQDVLHRYESFDVTSIIGKK
jgi:hypothetical protein